MRLASIVLCSTLLAACATHSAVPVASAKAVPAPSDANPGVEVRHMYLFAPGKTPVRIVERAEAPSIPVEVSSEPPRVR
jgi:hypothetical protein